MNSGQKIGLTSSLIKKKIEQEKSNKPQQPILAVPTLDDKQRLRKKIAEYKRIQRRQYPKKKVIQTNEEIPQMPVSQEIADSGYNFQEIKQDDPQNDHELADEQPNQNQNMRGKLESQLLQQYVDNEFYDDECEQADKDLENIKQDDAKFKKKMKRVSSIMERLSRSVHQLKNRYDEIQIEELLGRKRNKKKQAQALAFVKSQVEQKKEMAKKYDSLKESQTKKKEIENEAKKKEEEKEKEKKLKEIKKELQQKKRQKEKERKQKQERQEKAKRFLGKYLEQEPLYKVLEQKFQKKENKEKQIQKAYLKKRREKFKPFQEKDLTQHLKIHYEKIRDNQQVKQQQKIEKQQLIMQQNLKLLQKIYRGKNYERIQQELEEREKMKEKYKQKRVRLKKYEAYVKQNFKPEVKQDQEEEEDPQMKKSKSSENDNDEEDDEENQNEEKQEKQQLYRKVKRYKFLQGKSCGQVIETVKMPLSEKLQRRVGDGYLQHLKSLPKKKKSVDDRNFSQQKLTQAPSSKSRLVQIPKMPRPKHFNVQLSDNPNRQQINNLLILLKSKDGQVQMKQKHLINLSDRSKQDNIRNEINTNIVENIQRKLSLLTKL